MRVRGSVIPAGGGSEAGNCGGGGWSLQARLGAHGGGGQRLLLQVAADRPVQGAERSRAGENEPAAGGGEGRCSSRFSLLVVTLVSCFSLLLLPFRFAFLGERGRGAWLLRYGTVPARPPAASFFFSSLLSLPPALPARRAACAFAETPRNDQELVKFDAATRHTRCILKSQNLVGFVIYFLRI